MAFIEIDKIKIAGISACVPTHIEENLDLPIFREGEAERVIASTGIERKRVVIDNTTTSDLCIKAAITLLDELSWSAEDVDCLFYVCTNRDYFQPMTSCVIHGKLGLKEECFVMDLPCGCPGWLYGLSIISSFMAQNKLKKGLLLAGDTSSKMNYEKNKGTRPLFGDAGTVTALLFDDNAKKMNFHFGTNGKSFSEIITTDGGAKFPFSEASLKEFEYSDGLRRPIDCALNGMNVFAFSITDPPKSIKKLINHLDISPDSIDYFFVHQANKYIVDKIRKKINIAPEKTPTSLTNFGNTSSASIPLTIVTQCREELTDGIKENIASAFGTGLMWASAHFFLENIVCPKLIEY